MRLVQCPSGHYYDADKSSSCPHCTSSGFGVGNYVSSTQSISPQQGYSSNVGATVGVNRSYSDPGPTVGVTPKVDEQKTVGIISNAPADAVVVGWLVCIKGDNKGKDFRLHAERNFVGRGDNLDVTLSDKTISRGISCIVSFEPRNKIFRVLPSEARCIVYHNGQELLGPNQLNAYDTIEIGKTTLCFVPFCSEKFEWDEDKE